MFIAGLSLSLDLPAQGNLQGLWWAAPAASESGWGLHIAHQGNTVFVTWLTYDEQGDPTWFVMPAAKPQVGDSHSYEGFFYLTSGPHFAEPRFDPTKVHVTPVGQGLVHVDDPDTITLITLIGNGPTQRKRLTRQAFGRSLPTCDTHFPIEFIPNHTDLWWAGPAGSESGWGIAIAQQGDVALAAWLTYDARGKNTWYVMSNGRRTADSPTFTFTGELYHTRGPAHSASPWNPADVTAVPVGTAALDLTHGKSTFTFSIDGLTRTTSITPQVFSSPPTTCSEP
jgi:hypothetical protein